MPLEDAAQCQEDKKQMPKGRRLRDQQGVLEELPSQEHGLGGSQLTGSGYPWMTSPGPWPVSMLGLPLMAAANRKDHGQSSQAPV